MSVEGKVQQEIDQHRAEVTGTFARLDRATGRTVSRIFRSDVYVITYRWSGQPVEAGWRDVPSGLRVGQQLCVEINSEMPEQSRPCGTRGGLDDAREGMLIGSGFLTGSVVLVGVCYWMFRRADDAEVEYRKTEQRPAEVDLSEVAGRELMLRPSRLLRSILVVIFASLPIFPAAGVYQEGGSPVVVVVLLVLAALIASRLWRIRIRCEGSTVTVFGLVGAERIPTEAVVDVTRDHGPAIRWRDEVGLARRTGLVGFWSGQQGTYPGIHAHNVREVARLRAWISANREPKRASAAP